LWGLEILPREGHAHDDVDVRGHGRTGRDGHGELSGRRDEHAYGYGHGRFSQRAFGPVIGWLRMAFNDTGEIRGRDTEIQKLLNMSGGGRHPMPIPKITAGSGSIFCWELGLPKSPLVTASKAAYPFTGASTACNCEPAGC